MSKMWITTVTMLPMEVVKWHIQKRFVQVSFFSKYTLNFSLSSKAFEIVSVLLKKSKNVKICTTLLLGLSKIVQQ
jgi:hypothetical protein